MAQVQAQRTTATDSELRAALIAGHVSVFGAPPSENRLSCAWAQCMLETGRMQSCWNWNVGNIKATNQANQTWVAIPVKAGSKEPPNQVAYDSLESGCDAYWSLLQLRYQRALRAADTGDAGGFGVALGEAHYYTAPIGDYSQSLQKLADEYRKKWPFGPFGGASWARWAIAGAAGALAAFVAWREKRKGRRA